MSRMEGTEKKKSVNLKTTMEITQFEQQREEAEIKMNKISETGGTKTKCLIFMLPEFWKKREIRMQVKRTQRHNG